jgi:hypothetical protein
MYSASFVLKRVGTTSYILITIEKLQRLGVQDPDVRFKDRGWSVGGHLLISDNDKLVNVNALFKLTSLKEGTSFLAVEHNPLLFYQCMFTG